jgi:hypothetical protein
MDLYEELGGIVDALNDAGIDYAVCGGMAVGFHGHPRLTKDIDLLVLQQDVPRIQAAVARCGFDLPPARLPFDLHTERERWVVRISKIEPGEHLVLDLLLVTPGFERVWADRLVVEWRERPLQVVSIEGLGFMKRLAGRLQDLADLENLGVPQEPEERPDA